MSKTLVIHSGTYKTGSSAIQVYLSRAAHHDALGGARFAQNGRSIGPQHDNLTRQLRGDRSFLPEHGGWDELLREVRAGDAETTIISSEQFTWLDPEHLREIGRRIRDAGVGVRWIHYLRDQPSFYNAFYVERLITMRPEFAELINQPFEEFGTWSPIDLGIMRYAGFAEQLLAAIPGIDLRLRPFSRAQLAGGDIVEDFCATAGIPYRADLTTSTNVGTGWRTVETARRLSPLVQQGRFRIRLGDAANWHAIRMRWLTLIRSEFVKATTDLGWNTESAVYLTPEFRARLLAEYAEDNARVGELGGFDWPGIVAAEPVPPYNIGDYSEISALDLLTVIDRIAPLIFDMPEEILELREALTPPPVSFARRAARAARRRLG